MFGFFILFFSGGIRGLGGARIIFWDKNKTKRILGWTVDSTLESAIQDV